MQNFKERFSLFLMKFYRKIDLGGWMAENRWKDTTLSAKLTEMGTKISHTGVWYWRKGETKPKDSEILNNLSELAGFRAELFFLSEGQESRLKELSQNYDKNEGLKIIFDYL